MRLLKQSSGNDLTAIRTIAEQVETILKGTKGTNFIRTTFQQDYYGIRVNVNDEVANRLGFSSQDIAMFLAEVSREYLFLHCGKETRL